MNVFHINITIKTRLNPTEIPIIQRKQPLLSKRDVSFFLLAPYKTGLPPSCPFIQLTTTSMNSSTKVQRKWAYWHCKRSHHPPNTRNHQNLSRHHHDETFFRLKVPKVFLMEIWWTRWVKCWVHIVLETLMIDDHPQKYQVDLGRNPLSLKKNVRVL